MPRRAENDLDQTIAQRKYVVPVVALHHRDNIFYYE